MSSTVLPILVCQIFIFYFLFLFLFFIYLFIYVFFCPINFLLLFSRRISTLLNYQKYFCYFFGNIFLRIYYSRSYFSSYQKLN